MRENYDFRRAKRGRFPDLAGAHVVVVSPAIWKHFGTEARVIAALEELAGGARPAKARRRRQRHAA